MEEYECILTYWTWAEDGELFERPEDAPDDFAFDFLATSEADAIEKCQKLACEALESKGLCNVKAINEYEITAVTRSGVEVCYLSDIN